MFRNTKTITAGDPFQEQKKKIARNSVVKNWVKGKYLENYKGRRPHVRHQLPGNGKTVCTVGILGASL